jgi:homoserine kinase type II
VATVAQFTRLVDADLTALCSAFALGPVSRVQPISAGTINSNFLIDTERGRWFLRINEGKAEADVAWEAQLVGALADGGVVTPPPVVAASGLPYAPLDGTDKWVSVFPWRPGHHLAPHEVTPAAAELLGGELARLHLVGQDLPASWRRRSIYDHDHLVERFAGVAGDGDAGLARAIAVLGDELAICGAATEVRQRATHGMIHGDLFRDNVLWQDGRVVAILDFEQASGGSFAYDLAVCINDWCWTGAVELGVAAALVAGYQRVRALTAGDREALTIEVRAAAARFTITRITDVYLAKVDNPDKDFRAFLARCDAWRGPALGQLSALL